MSPELTPSLMSSGNLPQCIQSLFELTTFYEKPLLYGVDTVLIGKRKREGRRSCYNENIFMTQICKGVSTVMPQNVFTIHSYVKGAK